MGKQTELQKQISEKVEEIAGELIKMFERAESIKLEVEELERLKKQAYSK